GVGRALWFVSGGSVPDVIGLVSTLPVSRHGDIWSGIGLAMTYAGPVSSNEIAAAFHSVCANEAHYAQGVASTCEARVLAGHVPVHTNIAAQAIWGLGAEEVSRVVRDARSRLPEANGDLPRYELWRQSVTAAFQRITGQQS